VSYFVNLDILDFDLSWLTILIPFVACSDHRDESEWLTSRVYSISVTGKVTVRSVNLLSVNEVDRFVPYWAGLSFIYCHLRFLMGLCFVNNTFGALYVYCRCFVNIWIQEAFYDDNEFRCPWLSDLPRLLTNSDHPQQLFLSEGAEIVLSLPWPGYCQQNWLGDTNPSGGLQGIYLINTARLI